MGSHTATYAAVALAIAIVSLLAGFSWGRSDLKSKIEAALEKASVSLDAREFAMRQQLDEAFAEVSRLRPLAEELGAVQDRLKREQAKYDRMRSEFSSAVSPGIPEPPESQPESSESPDEAIHKLLQSLEAFNAPEGQTSTTPSEIAASVTPAAAPSAVIAPPRHIEAPLPPPPAPVVQPAPAAQIQSPAKPRKSAQPPMPRPASQSPQQPNPAPPQPQKAKPTQPHNVAPPVPRRPAPAPPARPASALPAKSGHTVDEWQEFARQLEALTGKKK